MIPPTMQPPVLNAASGRWASEVMTGETAGHGMFPSQSQGGWGDMGSRTASNATPHSGFRPAGNPSRRRYNGNGGGNNCATPAAAADGGPPMEGTASFGGDEDRPSALATSYPPPPPPPLMPGEDVGRSQQRFMRWFQIVDAWEAGSLDDRLRLVVAPVPRPPPFVTPGRTTVPLAGMVLLRRTHAPYDFAGWVVACRRWWAHVARHFERLSYLSGAGPSPPVSLITSPQPVAASSTAPAAAPPSSSSRGLFPSMANHRDDDEGGVTSPAAASTAVINPPQPPPPDLLDLIRHACVGFDDSVPGADHGGRR
jgi:hypothetical protein